MVTGYFLRYNVNSTLPVAVRVLPYPDHSPGQQYDSFELPGSAGDDLPRRTERTFVVLVLMPTMMQGGDDDGDDDGGGDGDDVVLVMSRIEMVALGGGEGEGYHGIIVSLLMLDARIGVVVGVGVVRGRLGWLVGWDVVFVGCVAFAVVVVVVAIVEVVEREQWLEGVHYLDNIDLESQ